MVEHTTLAAGHLILLGLLGCVAGFLNVMAGGGSLLTMPLMLFMGIPGCVANGTNRLAILLQNISGAISFYRQGIHRLRESMLLAACAVPGSIAGALVGVHFSGIWFKRFMAVVMILMLVLMVRKNRSVKSDGASKNNAQEKPGRPVLGMMLLFCVGFYGGVIQAGVGFLMILVLNKVMRYDLVITNAHKVVVIAAYTVPAMIIFAVKGEVLWLPAAILAMGNVVGAWFGAVFAVQRGEKLVRTILLTAMTVITALLVYQSFLAT